jgi:Na+-translocating ferredoxin:NAD+ oxidoreductase RnfC subunit
MELMGAERGVVGIKVKYQHVIDVLRGKLAANMDIAELRDAYPAGDEFILTYDVTGRVVPPGGIPLNVGVASLNVETALNVTRAASGPVVEKYLTVAGAVREPVTLRVPVGITLRECIEAAGGATVEPANYVVGGVMMGRLEDDHDALVDKTTGGVIVLGDDHVVVRRRRQTWQQLTRIGRSACDQCSFCTELCPRWLLGHPIEPHRAMRSLEFNRIGQANVIGTAYCCECNLCSLYACPEDLDPKNVCGENKARLRQEGVRWEDPTFNPRRPDVHLNNRKAPMRRLMQKLALTQFVNVGPLQHEPLTTGRAGIKLRQHVGSPCEPTVQEGDTVTAGQVVGLPPMRDGKPELGAPVHASIAGKVATVGDGVVWIEA